MARRGRLHAGLALLLCALAVVAAGRVLGLARATAAGGAEAAHLARTARNETRWYGWAERHPVASAAVRAAAPRVAPGSRVLWVVPPAVDPRWLEIVALYHLPAAWPAAVVRRGAAEATAASAVGADVRVDVYGDGRCVVSPLGSVPSAGSEAGSGGGGSEVHGRR